MSIITSASTTPIDVTAAFTPAIWAGAGELPLTVGSMLVKNDSKFLYVALDLTRVIVNDTGDYCWLAFDVDRNGRITPGVDLLYSTYPTPPIRLGRQLFLGPGTLSGLGPTAALVNKGFGSSAASSTPHRIWQIRIPLIEINVTISSVPQSICFGVTIGSSTTNICYESPSNFSSDFSQLHHLVLASSCPQVLRDLVWSPCQPTYQTIWGQPPFGDLSAIPAVFFSGAVQTNPDGTGVAVGEKFLVRVAINYNSLQPFFGGTLGDIPYSFYPFLGLPPRLGFVFEPQQPSFAPFDEQLAVLPASGSSARYAELDSQDTWAVAQLTQSWQWSVVGNRIVFDKIPYQLPRMRQLVMEFPLQMVGEWAPGYELCVLALSMVGRGATTVPDGGIKPPILKAWCIRCQAMSDLRLSPDFGWETVWWPAVRSDDEIWSTGYNLLWGVYCPQCGTRANSRTGGLENFQFPVYPILGGTKFLTG